MRSGARPATGLVARAVIALVAGIAVATAIVQPAPASAQEPAPTPTAVPTGRPMTCVERYPAEGPGGVDLQLGCVVGELVAYVGGLGPSKNPQRLTSYLVPAAAIAAGVAALVLALRALNRRAARRIASATPVAWWGCPACRSLNAAGRESCYRCGRPFEPGLTEMRTDAEVPAPQSFGHRYDGK